MTDSEMIAQLVLKLREVIVENNRLRQERAAAIRMLNEPETEPVHTVEAFTEHWASMGAKAPVLAGDVWKTGVGKFTPYIDYLALYQGAAQGAVAQADGHADPPTAEETVTADEAAAYRSFRERVLHTGPYFTFEAWKAMGRPRA